MSRKKIKVEVEVTPGDISIDDVGIVWIPLDNVDFVPKEIFGDKKAAAAGTATATA